MFLLQQVIQQAKFEAKYGVNVKVDPDTGEVSVTKQPKDETDETENSSCKKKRKKSAEIKSNKNELRKKKLEEMKMKKLEETRDDFERFQDHVKFGETVHAPPTFKSLPRKMDSMDTKDKVCIIFAVNKF
jgi:formate dehydrogenase assembly factor FdhD